MSKDERYKGRAPLPPKGGPMQDKKKQQRKAGARGQALRKFRREDES